MDKNSADTTIDAASIDRAAELLADYLSGYDRVQIARILTEDTPAARVARERIAEAL